MWSAHLAGWVSRRWRKRTLGPNGIRSPHDFASNVACRRFSIWVGTFAGRMLSQRIWSGGGRLREKASNGPLYITPPCTKSFDAKSTQIILRLAKMLLNRGEYRSPHPSKEAILGIFPRLSASRATFHMPSIPPTNPHRKLRGPYFTSILWVLLLILSASNRINWGPISKFAAMFSADASGIRLSQRREGAAGQPTIVVFSTAP